MTKPNDTRLGEYLAKPREPLPEWVVPMLVASVALPTFGAFWIGGRPGLGAVWGAVNIVFALVLAIGRRRDTIRLLSAADDDERTRLIAYQSNAAMGLVLFFALVALFLAAGLRGETGLLYGVLLLAGEGARIATVAVLNRTR
jgi:hypothetical protein